MVVGIGVKMGINLVVVMLIEHLIKYKFGPLNVLGIGINGPGDGQVSG